MKLYNYWRSGTSYRVRIALQLKGISYEYEAVDLRTAAHKSQEFLSLNPQGLVPSLVLDDGTTLSQSPAIIEYLEERYTDRPLLPADPAARAQVRAMAAVIGCDIHPLNNLRILKYLRGDLRLDQNQTDIWAQRWISDGFSALEAMLAADSSRGDFCHANQPGLVECYLLPQIYSARRFNQDMSAFPALCDIEKACMELAAFEKAFPENQPDAD
ncbi:maleylacetoacetate isomerase [Parvularcula sp. IMCC14364]|uniref:maleylacetoacetate isomerase n=1 Tax=Parvularcula sp. IMCC14364 TaxID=3067902 RepID=UPI0027428EE3|nr:maleylacetoacetate isomerase [Parvularcula sp. IMCC14364]